MIKNCQSDFGWVVGTAGVLGCCVVKRKGKCSKKPLKIMTQLSWALARQSKTERILTTLLISWHEGQQQLPHPGEHSVAHLRQKERISAERLEWLSELLRADIQGSLMQRVSHQHSCLKIHLRTYIMAKILTESSKRPHPQQLGILVTFLILKTTSQYLNCYSLNSYQIFGVIYLQNLHQQ